MSTHSRTTRRTPGETTDRFLEAIAYCARLHRGVRVKQAPDNSFQALASAIEALPIALHEYAWLRARVRNSKAYNDKREPSAAAYELGLAVNRLVTRHRMWQVAAIDDND
jgi:hypothetical protein